MEKIENLELIKCVNSCRTVKDLISKHRKVYDMIYMLGLNEEMFNGIYYYDKDGIKSVCEELYGDKYDLSEFLNDGKKYYTKSESRLIPVYCKKHGRINISIGDLLSGVGCHKCIRDRRNEIREAFLQKNTNRPYETMRYSFNFVTNKLKSLYGNRVIIPNFDNYENTRNAFPFECIYHGKFQHKIRCMLDGSDCPYCNLIKETSLILKANGVENEVESGIIHLSDSKTIGISGCDINLSLDCNIYDILSKNKIIYDFDYSCELWKDIEGFSSYLISDFGRVKNIKTGRFLNGTKNKRKEHKEISVGLMGDNGKKYSFLLHRLVYSTFIGNIGSNINIDHLDGNPSNNNLKNLKAYEHIKENIKNEITILSIKIKKYINLISSKKTRCHDYNVTSLEGEFWVDVLGMEDLYEVSNLGRIRSKPIKVISLRKGKVVESVLRTKMLKPHLKYGYYFIGLGRKPNRIATSVHKIVYESFNGKLPEGYEIDHINRIKTDNRLENLRAVTRTENLANRVFKKNR